MFTITRREDNPLISPMKEHPWEAGATFNPCPIMDGKICHMLYRAMSEPEMMKEPHLSLSVIGHAVTADFNAFSEREPLIAPDKDFDKFGCEDPRVVKFGSSYYIFYTALSKYPFSADSIRVAVAKTKDFKTIDEKRLVTPFNAKAMALFPEKINGKMAALVTVNTDIPPSRMAFIDFDSEEEMYSPEYWNNWYKNVEAQQLNARRLSDDQVELGAPPIKTKKGWLVIYSHIQRYSGNKVFGTEALLLDLKNPRKIIGRTYGPFLAPEAAYEKIGHVPNIVFPSGALVRDEFLDIYYGGADTYCCMATVNLENLLRSMEPDATKKFFARFPGNPIIAPRPGVIWEANGTFNTAAIDLGGKIHLLYRAQSADWTSTIGYASSEDGFAIDERLDDPIYVPRENFEMKSHPGNSGCEDPRIVKIGERIYMFYTAYDGNVPKVAATSISVGDFQKKKWNWAPPQIITPPDIHEKDSCLFPEMINGKYMILHRVNDSMCADFFATLDFSKEKINKCVEMLSPRRGMWDGKKVGISAPPIKTKKGWLLLYHGVSDTPTYRVGAILLDLKDPTIVLSRTAVPILEPVEQYEKNGEVPRVVFPCGAAVRSGTIYLYYGAADTVIGVATGKLSALLKILER